LGELPGSIDEGGVVECDEGGEGSVGTSSLYTGDVRVWAIKGDEVGVRGRAFEEGVESASKAFIAFAGIPPEVVGIGEGSDSIG